MTSGFDNKVNDVGRAGEIPPHTPLSDNPKRKKARQDRKKQRRDKNPRQPGAEGSQGGKATPDNSGDHEIDYYA
jgi:hypothetical protein